MHSITARLERHQVALYLLGLGLGALVGLGIPAAAAPAGHAILPILALLLYTTFLGIPFAEIGRAFRDRRFLAAILVVNFVLAPLVAWVLSRTVAHDQVLLVGVLFVLLTPCIDYVIVFTGLAGGDSARVVAASPLLMLVQMVMLPLYLWAMVGAEFVAAVEFGQFVEAFLVILVLPLVSAVLTRVLAGRVRAVRRWAGLASAAMVPLMVVTLAVVVASQVGAVGGKLADLLLVIPVYVVFAAVMVPVGAAVGRLARVDVSGRRAVVFSGVTRNSLVVLPLVLALPPAFSLAPLVVVTQTLVELLVMVALVRLIPRLLPQDAALRARSS